VSESSLKQPPDLHRLRVSLEKLDRELLTQIKERMALSEAIAAAKLQAAYPFRDQQRAEKVIQDVRHHAVEVGLDPHQMEQLFRLLMEMSITHQQAYIRELEAAPLRISYQGVEGSFSHLTAQRHYGGRKGGVLLTGYETFRGAADAARSGASDFALLPIENSTAGSINETYDLLAEDDLKITAEVVSQVAHCLLGLPGAHIEDLRTVLSHPQALMQCESFLREHPQLEPQAVFDTAGAARQVMERNDAAAAAIASESAASVFGLEVLARGIQTQRSNYTRFVEVALEAPTCPRDVPCKTSLLLATGHHPGDLGHVLTEFSHRSVNITKLESRPSPGKPWQYRFYLDVEGHAASRSVTEALEAVRRHTAELRILGTYPMAPPLAPPEPES
jgi:chorismate mutase/prephenate dehydratase